MASSSGNDDDLTIPRAAINKMIKETLPNVRVANDARELVVNCCTEFIHLVSSEANEICNKSEKKTISPEHVINALESLGFGSYITEVKDVLQECKTVALKRRKASSRLENLGIPEEELLRQQQELFAKPPSSSEGDVLPPASSEGDISPPSPSEGDVVWRNIIMSALALQGHSEGEVTVPRYSEGDARTRNPSRRSVEPQSLSKGTDADPTSAEKRLAFKLLRS
ncbi:protein Dr1 [Silurus asotus]|uniref:Protein Dr1 n=1 Tax=Silurus asotus TaxID=30991 RepID=A0AAD5FT89_SILAS|nr:protein Dr1 [Silurus asotus]